MVPTTAGCPKKARVVDRRKETGKERQPLTTQDRGGRTGRWQPAKRGNQEKALFIARSRGSNPGEKNAKIKYLAISSCGAIFGEANLQDRGI